MIQSRGAGHPLAASPRPAPSKLQVKRLCVTFAKQGRRTEVLRDIDLSVAAGELVCLLGPSGCGKTTLLQVMGGFLAPTSGSVLIDEEPVAGPDPRRIFVFQERGLFPWLTTEENIGFGIDRLRRAERQERIEHYVALVGLRGFERAFPHELSGGMKQRVEVARALAMNPDVLFLDEPFGALDAITRLTLRRELLRIWEAERKTILFVTHDIEESVQLADRIVVLSQRPAVVRRVVDVEIPHPRDLSARRYLELRDSIAAEIGLAYRV
ncbi:MAG TPA: ABC transporter ATP-binding protein [Thermoanaerobaculia bacterium]|nr:ABC transporter ATP-binding protein [Thermoanaerobaculia bacterium]